MKVRAWLPTLTVTTALAVLAGALYLLARAEQRVSPLTDATEEQLGDATIPMFTLHEASLDEVLAKLNAIRSHHPALHRFDFGRWNRSEFPAGFQPIATRTPVIPPIPGLETGNHSLPGKPQRYSTNLENIPADLLLRYLAGLFDCSVAEQHDRILFIEGAEPNRPIHTHRYTVTNPPPLLRSAPRSYLEAQGVLFRQGAHAEIRGNRLTVTNVQVELDLCDALFGVPDPTLFDRARWQWLVWTEKVHSLRAP